MDVIIGMNGKSSKQEMLEMMKLVCKLNVNIRFDSSGSNGLISSLDKSLIPFFLDKEKKIKPPRFFKKENYFQEGWNMFLMNEILLSFYKNTILENTIMEHQIADCKRELSCLQRETKLKDKARRIASEIVRSFQCPYENCKKRYGTQAAMNLHIKNRHSGGLKSDRNKFAISVFNALKNNKPLPETDLKLPGNFVDRVKEVYEELRAQNFKNEFEAFRIMDGTDGKRNCKESSSLEKREYEGDYGGCLESEFGGLRKKFAQPKKMKPKKKLLNNLNEKSSKGKRV